MPSKIMRGVTIFLYLSLSLSKVIQSIGAIIPLSNSRARSSLTLTFVEKTHVANHLKHPSDLLESLLVRGGDIDSDEEEYDSDEEDYDELTDDDDESEEDEEDESDEDDDEEEDANPVSSLPVKITLKTCLSSNVLIDQSIEITASPTRTVESLKQSVSRQFKSRPPMDAITLRLDGQVLDDAELVRNLVDDEDDEDEDEDDSDDEDDGDDDGLAKLTIIVDMVPPVDPKFGTEMKSRLDDLTNEEVLDAYIANLASLHQNTMELMQEEDEMGDDNDTDEEKDDEEDEDEEDEDEDIISAPSIPNTNLAMQRYSHMLREQIVESFSPEEKELLEKTDTPSSPQEDDLDNYEGDLLLKESIKRRKRKGGATMNVKRALQKNLNINWPDTIRNFLLFLFFGYFGGRNAMSRTIMLLGAPACFIIQARPVKVAIKQMFYTIGEPPGILLTLLPAPLQAIMSCNYDDSLAGIYGSDIHNYNDMVNAGGRSTDTDSSDGYDDSSDDSDDSSDFEEEYDEYDEDY